MTSLAYFRRRSSENAINHAAEALRLQALASFDEDDVRRHFIVDRLKDSGCPLRNPLLLFEEADNILALITGLAQEGHNASEPERLELREEMLARIKAHGRIELVLAECFDLDASKLDAEESFFFYLFAIELEHFLFYPDWYIHVDEDVRDFYQYLKSCSCGQKGTLRPDGNPLKNRLDPLTLPSSKPVRV